jgi:hypothetical protein
MEIIAAIMVCFPLAALVGAVDNLTKVWKDYTEMVKKELYEASDD